MYFVNTHDILYVYDSVFYLTDNLVINRYIVNLIAPKANMVSFKQDSTVLELYLIR